MLSAAKIDEASFAPSNLTPEEVRLAYSVAALHEGLVRDRGADVAHRHAITMMAECANSIRNIAGDAAARQAVSRLADVLAAAIKLDNMERPGC